MLYPAANVISTKKRPSNGIFSRTTWVSLHQKGETNLDFDEVRDDGMAVASVGAYANHLHLTPDREPRQHLITQFFAQWMLFLMPNQQCQNTEDEKCHQTETLKLDINTTVIPAASDFARAAPSVRRPSVLARQHDRPVYRRPLHCRMTSGHRHHPVD